MVWDFDFAVKTSILIFPFLALLLTIPFLVYQYLKYGATHWWKTVTVFSLVFYLLTAVFTVVLPLPTRESVAQMTGPETQLNLFNFVDQFRNHGLRTQGWTAWVAFVQTATFQQVFFNVLLMVPLGVYLRYYFKQKIIVTVLLSFSLSLVFELIQLSALFGLYPRPFRLFDVDDLLLNTIGGIVGYLMTPFIVLMFPSRDDMDGDQISRSEDVTFLRRIVANIIDLAMLGVLSFVSVLVLIETPEFMKYLMNLKGLVKLVATRHELFVIPMGIGLLYFTWLPWIAHGFTLGKRLVGIRLVDNKGNNLRYYKICIRYVPIAVIVSGLYFSFSTIVSIRGITVDNLEGMMAAIGVIMVIGLSLIIDFIYTLFSNKHFGYERMSGIVNKAI